MDICKQNAIIKYIEWSFSIKNILRTDTRWS